MNLQASMASELLTAERVAASLRDDILRGALRPGDRLKDAELAARFEVSRNTVRDGVRQLVTAGLVTTRLNASSTVRRLTEADAREIYTVRRTLELAGIWNSSRATAPVLAGMTAALEDAGEAAASMDWTAVGTASLRFHGSLAALNGSAQIDAFFSNILAQLRLVNAVMRNEADFQQNWIARDRVIADLVVHGQRAEAAAALKHYLDESESIIIDAIRASDAQALWTPTAPVPLSATHASHRT